MKIHQQIVNAIPKPALLTSLNLKFIVANIHATELTCIEGFRALETELILDSGLNISELKDILHSKEVVNHVLLRNRHNNICFLGNANLLALDEPVIVWTLETECSQEDNPAFIKQLIETIPNPLFYKNRQGIYTGCNRAFLKFLNRERSEIIGKTVFDIADRDIAEKYKEKDEELFETRQTQVYEWFVQTSDGELKNVVFHKNAILDENGAAMGLIGIIQDMTEYKKVEQALVESEDRFRSYVENAIDIFFTLNQNGVFTYVSPNWHPVLGHKAENILGRPFSDFVHPDDVPTGFAYIKKILEQGAVKESLEYRARHIDGSYRWQSSRGSVVKQGSSISILGVAHDIEDLKKAENEILQSETTYRGIINQISEAVYIQDEHGRFLDVNRAALNFYNYKRADFIGHTPEFLSAPGMNDIRKVFEYSRLAFEGCPQIFEFWGLKKDGTVFPKEIHMSSGMYFGKKCVITLAFDITERKTYEKGLKRLIDFQKTLVDLSIMFINIDLKLLPSAINYAIEETGKFLDADRAYIFDYDHISRTTSNTYEWCAQGITPTLAANQNIPFQVISEQMERHQREEIFFVPSVNEMPESEFKYLLEKENVKSLITLPLFANRKCVGFLGFDSVKQQRKWEQSEVTLIKILVQLIVSSELRKIHEKTILDARDAAQKSNRTKSDFLANISHEIRTPLNSVIGFTDLLLKSIHEGKQHTYLQIVRSSAYALYDLINDVLDFSKIEAGKLEIVPEKVEFEQFIDLVISTTAPEIHKKELEFILNIEGEIPKYVFMDSLRIRQILNNLLSNATKFTEEGEIELTVRCTHNEVESDVLNIYFEVRDTGIGISADYITKIFELFSQADPTTTRKYGGTGLGLAISNKLLQQMGSTIEVSSKENEGSRFYFTLSIPYAEMLENFYQHTIKATSAIVLDKNRRSGQVLTNMLSLAKIRIESFDTELFLNQPHIQTSDVIFYDIGIGAENDVQNLKKLRERTKGTQTFIIGLYKPLYHDCYEQARSAKIFDAFIEKPIAFYTLRKVLPSYDGAKTEEITENEKESNFTKPMTILIVEDNKASMMLSATIITRICPDCTIDKAYDGKEALAFLEQKKYTVILLDIQLPDIDGYEITRRIREQRKSLNYSTPIVALTAGVFSNEKERCIKMGMNDFIPKPTKESTLRAILEKYTAGE
jgi:PAS domain S-box-containing protein